MKRHAVRFGIFALLAFSSQNASANLLDDVFVEYSLMHIDKVKIGEQTKKPTFLRHNLELSFGIENLTFGLIYQRSDKNAETMDGTPEDGVMLTLGYYHVLANFLSIDGYARIGVTPDNDPTQPLYATDTDARVKLILFDPHGWSALLSHKIFPSIYGGVIVNQYGRTQTIAGLGIWWNGLSSYLTGYYALNGAEAPANPGTFAESKFASLKNAGVTGSLGYEIQIPNVGDLKLEVRQNVPFQNAGNDLRISISYRYLWNEQLHDFGGD